MRTRSKSEKQEEGKNLCNFHSKYGDCFDKKHAIYNFICKICEKDRVSCQEIIREQIDGVFLCNVCEVYIINNDVPGSLPRPKRYYRKPNEEVLHVWV